jgi:hypothetical protein
MVIKLGMSTGFAGVENELYFMDKTLMLFGDAKHFLADVIKKSPNFARRTTGLCSGSPKVLSFWKV